MDSQETFSALREELNYFQGQIHFGMPSNETWLGEHDVVLLETWTAVDLFSLGRMGCFQVAVYSVRPIADELKVFFDWQISSLEILNSLKRLAKTDFARKSSLMQTLKPALFLDRDGVVNVDHGYVGKADQVSLIPHVGEILAKANHAKWEVIVVTNQSGIGRGYYSEENFQQVMKRINELLILDQAKINRIEFSPFHPLSSQLEYKRGRHYRKPRPGMILRAQQSENIDLSKSVMIGDRQTDLMSAVAAGVGRIYLLVSEENIEDQKHFDVWCERLEKTHGVNGLMKGIAYHVISGLSEVRL